MNSSEDLDWYLTKYPCPCCGHYVFTLPPGSLHTCPICFWMDDSFALRFPKCSTMERKPLFVSQRNYATIHACDASCVQYVRPPSAEDLRDAQWRPLDEFRDDMEEVDDYADYNGTYPWDKTRLYYWRTGYWREPG